MYFNPDKHQKVRYNGDLYVVILEEFPQYHALNNESLVVVHPLTPDGYIIPNIDRQLRRVFTVTKSELENVEPGVTK